MVLEEVNSLTYIFLFCGGMCNGVRDLIDYHFMKSIFSDDTRFNQSFWNPLKSWMNKWKHGNPVNGEAYPMSSTILVVTTEGKKVFKWFMIKFIILAVCFHVTESSMIDVIAAGTAWYAGFWLTFESRLLRTN